AQSGADQGEGRGERRSTTACTAPGEYAASAPALSIASRASSSASSNSRAWRAAVVATLSDGLWVAMLMARCSVGVWSEQYGPAASLPTNKISCAYSTGARPGGGSHRVAHPLRQAGQAHVG